MRSLTGVAGGCMPSCHGCGCWAQPAETAASTISTNPARRQTRASRHPVIDLAPRSMPRSPSPAVPRPAFRRVTRSRCSDIDVRAGWSGLRAVRPKPRRRPVPRRARAAATAADPTPKLAGATMRGTPGSRPVFAASRRMPCMVAAPPRLSLSLLRRPGAGRDPSVRCKSGRTVDPGLRRDDNFSLSRQWKRQRNLGKAPTAFRCSHLATIFAAYSPMPQPGAAE